jgi:2-keto-3-deoxy-L-rhamnonate aldolase RhmA
MPSYGESDNPLIRKFVAGEAAICLPIRMSRSIHILQMAKVAGFDAVYMDMEHSPIGLDAVSRLSLAAWNMGLTPLVRTPSHSPDTIIRSLEGGAAGILVPHVDSAQDARSIVKAARFRPVGSRAMAGASPPLGYCPMTGDKAARTLEARTLVIAMIESLEAVANVDEIASVDGIDLLLVGTRDLSDEMGVHGQSDHPEIFAVYESVAAACRRHGRWLGVAGIKGQPEIIRKLRVLGASLITSTTDETLLLRAVRDEASSLHRAFTDVVSKPA